MGPQLGKIKEGEPVWLKVAGGLCGLGLRFTGNEARQASAIQRLLDRAGSER